MRYKFYAYGHPNILGTHKTTLEFTKDGEITLKGDCIIGVKSDFELDKIKELIKGSKNNKIKIIIEIKDKKEEINAELNPRFNSNVELVIRKTGFVSERTLAINADKAAIDLDKDLINHLKEEDNKISIIIENS
ncbi:hypothetical protein CMO83_02210 [Candidatus Woesearchaeota archaeon]|jgi:hypothetical protein|nr:hypothetical protein [Candidatus Woesearchaeota archaeon]|tara:strand:+ start:509 stop:910 length:402 start_codon:yes stop_codon:yes gene_type:complete